MSGEQAVLFRSIETLLVEGTVAGLDDEALLERFATQRDGRALAALIDTHGPMVLAICRRILRAPHDVEDAFQSTFLVLVRKAGAIRDPGRLGPWLHGVACRVALRIRSKARKLRCSGNEVLEILDHPSAEPGLQAERNELLGLIDEEVGRLPTRYRDVIVLCDLEGQTYRDAARRLRCPLGTVQSRLARGRDRLRERLARRGVGAAVGTALLSPSAQSSVPAALRAATVRAGIAACGGAAAAAMGTTLIAPGSTTLVRIAMAAAAIFVVLGTCLAVSGKGNGREEQPIAVAATAPQPPPPDPAPAAQPDRDRTVLLEVRSAQDNKPLPGASVWFQVKGGRLSSPTSGRTDAAGRYSIDLAGGWIASVTVVVAAEGHVPKKLRWNGENLAVNQVVGLERGVRIGGRVTNEQGRPIEGARVMPWAFLENGEEVAAAVTDAKGRWQSSAQAASALTDGKSVPLALWVTHPDYIAVSQSIPIDQAIAQNSVHTLKRGGSLSGTVLAPDGRPVTGAKVVADQSSTSSFRTTTDASGRFSFGHCLDPEWSSICLSVEAKDLAARVQKLLVTPTIPDQVIRLDRPRAFRGLVVDSQGKPVAGALIESSRGFENGKLDWQAESDAQGRFEWPEAPTSGEIFLSVQKTAFEYVEGRHFTTDQREITLTLHRPLHLHGTVTDAATGQPVERFDLIPGWGPRRNGDRVEWLRTDLSIVHLSNGRLDVHGGLFPDQGFNRSIRIEAEGYLPDELIGFRDDAEDIAHDFKLRKAAPLSGIVRGPDGKPLAGAKVGLSGDDNHVRMENGRLGSNLVVGEATHTTTGPDGRYRFRPQEHPVAIVVEHDAGFAVRTPRELAASADVTVSPWSRIEGVLRIGTHPAPNQKVSAWMVNRSFRGRVDYDTLTDEHGRFFIERVTPGSITVYRNVDTPDHRGWIPSNPVTVDVSPGQTYRVDVGGTGRPLIGRLQIPQGFSLADLVLSFGDLSSERREPRMPDDYPDFTSGQKTAWFERFYKTTEGKTYYTGDRKYAVDLHADGTFRIEDVPAGKYELKLHFLGRSDPDGRGIHAAAHSDVTVPAISGGRTDESLDLGVIRLDIFRIRELKVGDPTPAITRNAADGRPIDLGALRGKFVLLHFWETYQERSLADLPVLKETFEAFGRSPRFVMIGLNQDHDFDLPNRYAKRKGLAWEQRHVGVERPNPITAAFGVQFPPQVLLIGPDGRLIARDLNGPEIKEAVARALTQRSK